MNCLTCQVYISESKKYCSRSCSNKALSLRNKNNNNIRNKNYSKSIFSSREKVYNDAKQYYLNNTITIGQIAEKFNLPYYFLRKQFGLEGITKTNNQQTFKKKNWNENNPNLLNSNLLNFYAKNKTSLRETSEILNVSPNIIRLYAKSNGIYFNSISQYETEILEYVQTIDPGAQKTRKIISPFEIDVYSDKFKFGIELNGEYWHSEDKIDKKYHLNKQIMAEENGIKLIQIFLKEWIEKKDKIKTIILANMLQHPKVYARTLKFVELDKKEASKFFDDNHLQGWLKCKYVYGLVDKQNEIQCAVSLGVPRYDKSSDLELLRFCNKKDISVVGGFSKLIKNIEKELKFKSIITYSHRRLFAGNVYASSGFVKMRTTPPGYFWFNNNGHTLRRNKTQKHKLNTTLTEKEYMHNLNYRRVYDCGQVVYKYTKGELQ